MAVLFSVAGYRGYSQGTFVNLGFENPVLPLTPVNSEVPITNGLPGWVGYIAGDQVDHVLYNTVSIGAAAISLQGPGSLAPVLEGNYSAILQCSFGGLNSAAIGQTGQIPLDAQSLVFFEQNFGSLNVTFAGQPISLVRLGSGANYDIIGGDISAFAGQTGELRFITAPNSSGVLDYIQFSNQVVPCQRSVKTSQ